MKAVINTQQLIDLRHEVEKVYVDPALIQYSCVWPRRHVRRIDSKFPYRKVYHVWRSPRASINMIIAGRALAFVRGGVTLFRKMW